jgi:hypothetical protein
MNMLRVVLLLLLACITRPVRSAVPGGGGPIGLRYRVLVSTDIGGTDFDDVDPLIQTTKIRLSPNFGVDP